MESNRDAPGLSRGGNDKAVSRVGPVLSAAIAATAVGGVMPVFQFGAMAALVAADLNLSTRDVGLVSGAFYLALAITSWPLGRAQDRLPSSSGMTASVTLTGISLLMAMLAPGLGLLLVAMALAGVSNALAQASTSMAITQHWTAGRHGVAFGVKQLNGPIAMLLSGLLVAVLAVPLGWRIGFLAAVAVVVPFWLLRTRLPAAPVQRQMRVHPPASRGARSLIVVAGLASFTTSSLGSFFVLTAQERNLTVATASVLFSACGVAGIAGRLIWGVLVDRTSITAGRLMGLLLLIGAPNVVLFSFAGERWSIVLSALLVFLTGTTWGGLLLQAAVASSPERVGSVIGLAVMGVALGGVFGPPMFGAIAQEFSYQHAWLASAGLMLVAGLLMLRRERSQTRTTRA